MNIQENLTLFEVEEEEDEIELSVEEELNDLAADLVSFKRYSPFLERLFSQSYGTWNVLEHLCSGIKDIEQRFSDWEEAGTVVESVRVAWLDYPESSYGGQFCVIIFFCENPHWITDAIYNKKRFLKDLSASHDSYSFATVAKAHANRTQMALVGQVSAD
jgi:hypothetical protein